MYEGILSGLVRATQTYKETQSAALKHDDITAGNPYRMICEALGVS